MKDYIYVGLTLVLTILSITSYTPQLIKILKTKSVEDISLAGWFIYDIYFVLYIILLLYDSAGIGVLAVTLLETFESLFITVLVMIYRKK